MRNDQQKIEASRSLLESFRADNQSIKEILE